MAPFAGYLMPISYGKGIIHEHLHCRNLAGLFDISHMGQYLISGEKAAEELEQLAPSDMTGLKSGQQRYTVLTNDDGGTIDDIMVTRLDSGLRIVVNAACKDKDFRHLSGRLSDRCPIEELSEQALFALQGPAAASIMRKLSSTAADLPFMYACATELNGIQCTVSRSGYTGEDGFEIAVAAVDAETVARLLLAESEVAPVGLGARNTLRLEAGLCLYGHELDETVTPVEAGLHWLIKKGRSNFPGARKILEQLAQGTEVTLTGLVVDGKIPIRDGCAIFNDEDRIVGSVTSGSFAPSLGRPVAMARLERKSAVPDSRWYAQVRSDRIAVTVTRLPFLPHRYHR